MGLFAVFALASILPAEDRNDPMPFQHKIEVYRQKDGDVMVFVLRLEQPFLAEEFEKSNYLRLKALEKNALLIYPTDTKFHQKHAEFYGRLRGEGVAKLKLSYEMVTEKLDGGRQVDVRETTIEVPIPKEPGGPASLFQEWARQQNSYFLNLLNYYPEETFYQYVLLQSRDRYGVTPPPLPKPALKPAALETDLYDALTGSLAIQEALQHQTLTGGARVGNLDTHISQLSPPTVQSLNYAWLLEELRTKQNRVPETHDLAKLVPHDQYFVHVNSVRSAGELWDLMSAWGDSLLRLFSIQAQDSRLQEKFEEHLCLRRDPLTKLWVDGIIKEAAFTGSDPFVREGADVTVIFRLKQPDIFLQQAAAWAAQARQQHPDLTERDFNYRGHRITARYTTDRLISSFVVQHEDVVVYSNSHAAIRRLIDAAVGKMPNLASALDYQYVCSQLPPSHDPATGYLFASEAFIRRIIGPEAKIAEKRRLQCFNNLVMLNNASLFYRMEYGRAPASLSELIEGKFVDPNKVVCPHGGTYAFDGGRDTCTCSLHNRLKYLTPNVELNVLQVSRDEQQEYERYKQRYEAFWRGFFDPIAMRFTMGQTVKLEVCVLPPANGSLYQELRQFVDEQPLAVDTQRVAKSAVASLVAVRGRKANAEFLKGIPGIPEALQADPTLTDFNWLGDRVGLHIGDGDSVLEIDWTKLNEFNFLPLGKVSTTQQMMAAAAISSIKLPAYVTLDVEDRDKAGRLLDQLAAKIFLNKGNFFGLKSDYDGYRLPDYKGHAQYVFSYQLHALKIRLHVALVGNQLVAATQPELLREVIDAAANPPAKEQPPTHMLLRLNRRALARMHGDMQLYWGEKARLACHHNISAIQNLIRLYDAPVGQVDRLSEAKYGVRYFCPDHGVYGWDDRSEQVQCSVHGNRQGSRQHPRLDQRSSFAELVDSVEEVKASLRFQNEALFATVEIVRK
jgi:hypothetical protein